MKAVENTMRTPTIDQSGPVLAGTENPKTEICVLRRLHSHLLAVETCLGAQLGDFEPEIRSLAVYCLNSGGKRLRSALVFLAGWSGRDGDCPRPESVRIATVIELVHLATLVHDDIIDNAVSRRNRLSAARKFGSTRAVLLGDALFAQALHLAAQFPDTSVCRAVAAASRRVCSGEIMQTLPGVPARPDTSRYNRILALKTAELFRVACVLGAQVAEYSAAYTQAAGIFGKRLGMAYQLYDDLLDYFGTEPETGKTLGGDFVGGKITLPLLVLWPRLEVWERQELIDDLACADKLAFAKWRERARDREVFSEALAAVKRETTLALRALDPFGDVAAVPMLRQAMDILEQKIAALASATMRGNTA